MELDPDNPIVELCVAGMEAEAQGDPARARTLFLRAWDARQDDLDACIAAHFVARQADSVDEVLRWNTEALTRADAVGGDRVRSFYPSLYLNLGKSHEDLGDMEEARRCYDLGDAHASTLPDDGYATMVRRGIASGQDRTSATASRWSSTMLTSRTARTA